MCFCVIFANHLQIYGIERKKHPFVGVFLFCISLFVLLQSMLMHNSSRKFRKLLKIRRPLFQKSIFPFLRFFHEIIHQRSVASKFH